MNNKLPCELIRDLFPSYIDGLTSEVTNRLVQAHIDECPDCKGILEAMREPCVEASVEAEAFNDCKEIDFLKKTRTKTKKLLIGTMIAFVILTAVFVNLKIYWIGDKVYGEAVSCDVRVQGDHLILYGAATDEKQGIASVNYEEENGTVTVTFRAVRKSLFCKNEFQSEYTASGVISQVCIGNRIVWADGVSISDITSSVYETKHAYIGDMPANGRTVTALNMVQCLGNFKNELQTDTEPYGWTIYPENEIEASQLGAKENAMKTYAYILLSVIDNLGEVSYEYTAGGEICTLTVTAADASEFAGQDIKACGQDIVSLQKLIEKTGMIFAQ